MPLTQVSTRVYTLIDSANTDAAKEALSDALAKVNDPSFVTDLEWDPIDAEDR